MDEENVQLAACDALTEVLERVDCAIDVPAFTTMPESENLLRLRPVATATMQADEFDAAFVKLSLSGLRSAARSRGQYFAPLDILLSIEHHDEPTPRTSSVIFKLSNVFIIM